MTKKIQEHGNNLNIAISLHGISDEDRLVDEHGDADELSSMPVEETAAFETPLTLQEPSVLVDHIEQMALRDDIRMTSGRVPEAANLGRPLWVHPTPFASNAAPQPFPSNNHLSLSTHSSPTTGSTSSTIYTPSNSPTSQPSHSPRPPNIYNHFPPIPSPRGGPSPLSVSPGPYHPSVMAIYPHLFPTSKDCIPLPIRPLTTHETSHLSTLLISFSKHIRPLITPGAAADVAMRLHPKRVVDHLSHGAFDVVEFVEWIGEMVGGSCAPIRDAMVRGCVDRARQRFEGRECGEGRESWEGDWKGWVKEAEEVVRRWEEVMQGMRNDIEDARRRMVAEGLAKRRMPMR